MITLAVGRLEVDWGKNNVFTDHGQLFQATDLKQVPTYYAGEDWPDGDPIVGLNQGFGKPLDQIRDRLELLGYTLRSVEHQYDQLHKFHGLTDQPIPFATLSHAMAEVDVNRVNGNYGEDYRPGEFVKKEILERLHLQTEHSHFDRLRPDHWEVDLLLENFEPNARLRLLAENEANHELDVCWDFTPLVESGWAQRDEFKAGPSARDCFLIVTEGSSDAHIIQKGLQLYRPHVADFFQFVDMTDGYPFTGTGNQFRFAQGLVSIGIQNNTVVLYDNDAEGVSKHTKTLNLSLPPNIRSMQLPELEAFKSFDTIGPDGQSSSDINGRAAAIECYLDLSWHGSPTPVIRWTSFDRYLDRYQGELQDKTQYTKAFLSLRTADPSYDSTKLEQVLDHIIATCVSIAEAKMLAV